MVLLALGFMGITVALVLFQPGALPTEPAPEQPATRAGTALPLDTVAAPPDPAPEPATAPRPEPPRPAVAELNGDDRLRRMTWDTLSKLNNATGRDAAPGRPGSLLHTIVQRSLQSGDPQTAPVGDPPATYVVQPGDSLASIAEALYGDVNMTGPLFAANQPQLAQPDDLRAGQRLELPGIPARIAHK